MFSRISLIFVVRSGRQRRPTKGPRPSRKSGKMRLKPNRRRMLYRVRIINAGLVVVVVVAKAAVAAMVDHSLVMVKCIPRDGKTRARECLLMTSGSWVLDELVQERLDPLVQVACWDLAALAVVVAREVLLDWVQTGAPTTRMRLREQLPRLRSNQHHTQTHLGIDFELIFRSELELTILQRAPGCRLSTPRIWRAK